MTIPEDRAYFAERARREREIARSCEDSSVAVTHLRMAEAYERRAEELARQVEAAVSPITLVDGGAGVAS